jgi:lysophospholipid acyltransferase (LPLAT)-like uncharacterized protein
MQAARQYLPSLVVFLMRMLAWTWRWRVEDRYGITDPNFHHPLISVFWHNRMLAMPLFYERFCRGRRGSCLTSPSKDGAIIAGVMARFHIGSVRGSSSRGGSLAMREMTDILAAGKDIGITPDGPRGPKYRLHPGAIKLAQISGVAIMPVHVTYSHYWELKSWDAFRIPKPFARVTLVCGDPLAIPRDLDPEAFETARKSLETLLNQEPAATAAVGNLA